MTEQRCIDCHYLIHEKNDGSHYSAMPSPVERDQIKSKDKTFSRESKLRCFKQIWTQQEAGFVTSGYSESLPDQEYHYLCNLDQADKGCFVPLQYGTTPIMMIDRHREELAQAERFKQLRNSTLALWVAVAALVYSSIISVWTSTRPIQIETPIEVIVSEPTVTPAPTPTPEPAPTEEA